MTVKNNDFFSSSPLNIHPPILAGARANVQQRTAAAEVAGFVSTYGPAGDPAVTG